MSKTPVLMLFLMLVTLHVLAQPRVQDTVRRHRDFKKYIPTGIRIGTDIVSIIKDQRQENFSGWEMNADVDLDRFLLAVEYGSWGRDFSSDSASYHNNGSYWRAGIDVNFLTGDPERNVFFIGARYARSTYDESMSLQVEDPVYGFFERDYSNSDVSTRWFELTAGLKVRIWKIIWVGYTGRFKFGLKDSDNEMLSHDVPGYGLAGKESYWGFNYQVMLRIPVRKQPPVQVKKK